MNKRKEDWANDDNKFDIDLRRGQLAESELVKVLCSDTIEVKRDFLANKTGNIAVEFESRGNLSGILTTEATHWAFVLDNMTIIVEISKLKKFMDNTNSKIVKGGDDNTSKMVLIPLMELFRYA